ncbi:MAG: OadG family protein [Sulfurimonas sp.]|nr:OadG family protein [Sulfurimonas sp.]MDD3059633.1 OadG family protein [Sulfurimonas sp.]MDD5201837.1 OadG family protein [Sulfurimonas sp.]
METNLVVEGVKFMFLGMGAVFLFLALMIVMMNIMSYIIHRFFPEPQPIVKSTVVPEEDNRKIVAAITAAIAHHRQG